ncbi:MAG: N-acetylmuramic acid 6-phosphate etherase [Phycisphaeraceae bacterium]|nr:N-acetylmuramic acid 6-phosphate etherase [Phycisphaeraceae bacterium]
MSELPPDRAHVTTEGRHPRSLELDRCSASEIVALVAEDAIDGVHQVARAAAAIGAFADAVAERLVQGGRLIYAGAGTSGRLGVLDASECPPTFRSDPSQVVGIIAGGDGALRRSSEGREDEWHGIAPDFERLEVGPRDAFLGIAAGGTTPFVLGAIELAKARGALTGLLTCFPGARVEGCDHRLDLHTGPEILTGSTRLKAGTATKVALNAISTAVFVRLGKVHGNLMVDLAATNDKLMDRAIRILREFDESLDRGEAAAAIDAAGRSLKVAIVMRCACVDRAEAERRLHAARGSLRRALEA